MCDLFAGTTVVGRHFKRRGFSVISSDLMHYAFVFGKAYLETNACPQFDNLPFIANIAEQATLFDREETRLQQVLDFLNQLAPEAGFIYQNYCDEGTKDQTHERMYFSAPNAGRIDAIRNRVEQWRNEEKITEQEYYVLLAALLEAVPGVSNTSGTYAAFLKFWEARSQKTLTLTLPPLVQSERTHRALQGDAVALAPGLCCDLLYLDPPYNGRQYAPNYHVLETIARWDAPPLHGKSGMRPYQDIKSRFCRKETALEDLEQIASHSCARLVLLSYSSEGIMPHEAICEVLKEQGKLTVYEQPYRRYRSDKDHEKRQYKSESQVAERLYALERS